MKRDTFIGILRKQLKKNSTLSAFTNHGR
jgi:hypothetical protein